jgi:hypothetical protein
MINDRSVQTHAHTCTHTVKLGVVTVRSNGGGARTPRAAADRNGAGASVRDNVLRLSHKRT